MVSKVGFDSRRIHRFDIGEKVCKAMERKVVDMLETDDEYIEFFQELIDSGLAWSLQGSYARTARRMIDAGWCVEGGA